MRLDPRDSGVGSDLLGVLVVDQVHAIAVGRAGMLLRWDGIRWAREESGTDEDLYAICTTPDGGLFAVGGNLKVGGTSLILRLGPAGWIAERSPVQSVLLSVDADRDRVRAVGFNGDMCENAGSGWRQILAPTNAHLFCIRALGGGTWIACGLGGIIVDTDARDKCSTSVCDAHLTCIASGDADELIAVGFDGTVLRRHQATWRACASPTREHLWSVCYSAGQWLAVGAQGTVLAGSPDALDVRAAPCHEDLHAISAAGALAVAVGRRGTIIHVRADDAVSPS